MFAPVYAGLTVLHKVFFLFEFGCFVSFTLNILVCDLQKRLLSTFLSVR